MDKTLGSIHLLKFDFFFSKVEKNVFQIIKYLDSEWGQAIPTEFDLELVTAIWRDHLNFQFLVYEVVPSNLSVDFPVCFHE